MMYASCLPWDEHTNFRLLFIDLVLLGAVHLSLAGIIVHSVHPGNSSNSFPLPPAAGTRFSSVILGSDFLDAVVLSLCAGGEQRREEKKIYKNQNRTQEKRNYISFNSKSFSLESCSNNIIMGSNITGKGCVRFCVVVRFGSSSSSSSCCCCCCCRLVCCLLVRISKSFIIILWH